MCGPKIYDDGMVSDGAGGVRYTIYAYLPILYMRTRIFFKAAYPQCCTMRKELRTVGRKQGTHRTWSLCRRERSLDHLTLAHISRPHKNAHNDRRHLRCYTFYRTPARNSLLRKLSRGILRRIRSLCTGMHLVCTERRSL